MEFADIDEDDIKAFLVETYESVEKIERDIIELEKNAGNEEIVTRMYRALHSIKGNCGFLPFPKLESIAHAGEAGRGFAVVASEVKELAKQTAQATEDIGQRIEAIQKDTKEAVQAIADISEAIYQISDIQNTIASAVEEQTATTAEISRNVVSRKR